MNDSSQNAIQSEVLIPDPQILMVSLRSMGYSFEVAAADIIDNSISADATEIELSIPVNPTHHVIYILDDGHGMDENELREAMKLGSNIQTRDSKDLGRFGLGLKSASFSQCKQLTVVSKKNGKYCAMQWDIDEVIRTKKWILKHPTIEDLQKDYIRLNKLKELFSGTMVIWDKFDRFDTQHSNAYEWIRDNQLLSKLEAHLSLVFHMYLSGKAEKSPGILANSISIKINGVKIEPKDPFLTSHRQFRRLPENNVQFASNTNERHTVSIVGYLLPHKLNLSAEDSYRMGGIENMNSMSGIYIYRNDRLIQYGSWLGLTKDGLSTEMVKYGRIQVRIPSALDDLCHFDVKKQSVILPIEVRNKLKSYVSQTRIESKKRACDPSKLKLNDDNNKIWTALNERNEIVFRINRDATILKEIGNYDVKTKMFIRKLIEKIEEELPQQIKSKVNVLYASNIDMSSENQKKDIIKRARVQIDILKKYGMNEQDAIKNVFSQNPFCDFQEIEVFFLNQINQ